CGHCHFTSTVVSFCVNDPPTLDIYTLSLHDALPICITRPPGPRTRRWRRASSRSSWPTACRWKPRMPSTSAASRPTSAPCTVTRSEEHTSELQSPCNLVCRLLLEKKKQQKTKIR